VQKPLFVTKSENNTVSKKKKCPGLLPRAFAANRKRLANLTVRLCLEIKRPRQIYICHGFLFPGWEKNYLL